MTFRINSIFESISGEAGGFPQGTWCSFIRLQGCNISCRWCDTLQAQDKNDLHYEMDIGDILAMCRHKHVLITGGEPLLQKETPDLIRTLMAKGHAVQVETNGSQEIPARMQHVHWVIDRKCPSSGMENKMISIPILIEQVAKIQRYRSHAYVKWVVANEEDVDFMVGEILDWVYSMDGTVPFIVSPLNADGSKIKGIVEQIRDIDAKVLDYVTFSLQIHKLFNLL